jgi:PIN domain nuclease of toxin-antitoxin system
VLLATQALLAIGLEGIGSVPAKIASAAPNPETEHVVSAVSITEIVIKSSVGKIEASSQLIADLKMTVIPLP